MTRRRLLAAFVLLISALAAAPRTATLTAAQTPSAAKAAPRYGPPNGALVIAGGSTEGLILPIYDKFIELGGGVDGTFVIVPTAMGNFDETGAPRVWVESQVTNFWRNNRGLKNVKMLHTHDPNIANTAEFAQALSDATGVWFTGGRHHHIVDSYAGTLTYTAFHKVLERGGVIGGNSAGATIQGEYLVRGDSRNNRIVMTHELNHQNGFAFLRRSAIDQHIDARDRWDDLIPVIKRYPNLLGIGISEDTAIVVTGDQFEVIGSSAVAIHDNTRKYRKGDKPYYLLSAGDTYNMRTRQATYADAPPAPSTAQATGTARQGSAASSLPTNSLRPAAPSGRAAAPSNGSGAVPALIPNRLPRLLEHLLMVAGNDESRWLIEVIDADSDGEIDLLRIHLLNGDIWEITR